MTSPTGAAIRDFLEVLRRRWRGAHVLIVPVRVQGEGAADEIAAGIELVNRLANPIDVLVVARGGGSLEDLWSFNEEVVVRAIYASRIPVVSAVGHEIDVTLSDLVADVRALTPSEAAERIVPAVDEVLRGAGTAATTPDAFAGRAGRGGALATRRGGRLPRVSPAARAGANASSVMPTSWPRASAARWPAASKSRKCAGRAGRATRVAQPAGQCSSAAIA